MKFTDPKFAQLKNHNDVIQIVIKAISKNYWELKPKQLVEMEMQEMKVEVRELSANNVFSLFGVSSTETHIPYQLGKKHNYTSGSEGRARLVKLIEQLHATNSTDEVIRLLGQFRQDNKPGSNLSRTLMYVLPECVQRTTAQIAPVQQANQKEAMEIIAKAEQGMLNEYNFAMSLSVV